MRAFADYSGIWPHRTRRQCVADGTPGEPRSERRSHSPIYRRSFRVIACNFHLIRTS
jgi:hypothetical protein